MSVSLRVRLCVCRLNDIIVSVNGVTTVNVTHAGAVDALKRAGYAVDMVCLIIYSLELIVIINFRSYGTNHLIDLDHLTGCICASVCQCVRAVTFELKYL